MRIKHLSEDEQKAILNPPGPPIPSKDDVLRQIEADYLAARREEDKELMAALDERHKAVSAAKSDKGAHSAYQRAVTEATGGDDAGGDAHAKKDSTTE